MTFDLIKYRFASETIKQNTATSFEMDVRRGVEFVAPLPGVNTGVAETILGNMGETANGTVFVKMVSNLATIYIQRYDTTYYSWGNTPEIWYYSKNVAWGIHEYDYDLTDKVLNSTTGYINTIVGAKATVRIENVLVLSDNEDITRVDIINELNYVVNKKFRAGTGQEGIVAGGFPGGYTYHYGMSQYEIERREALYSVDGDPKLSVDLGWTKFKIL